jgi:hypothetical protein
MINIANLYEKNDRFDHAGSRVLLLLFFSFSEI